MRIFFRLTLVLAFLGLTVLFNIGLIDIRFEEIRYLLGTIAAKQDISNTFGIVAKYELIKRRMVLGEDNISNYELEAKIQALTSGEQFKEKTQTWTAKAYRIPLRLSLNGIRILLGKQIVSPKEEDRIFSVLEIAYFWERNRKYVDALKVYDEVLGTPGLTSDIRAAVMVHKAFCHSMQSNYDESKRIYEQVINLFPNTEAGVLSWKLLDFIQSMERQRSNLQNAVLSEFEKAKQFYMLMDFRNAVKSLSVFLDRQPEVSLAAQARFYKGRSFEELGETEDAVSEYKEVMRIDGSKVWAKQANRRMLMLGEFYEQRKQITDEAKRQLEAYQDQLFIKNVEKYSGMVASENSLRGELMKEKGDQKGNALRGNDSLLNLINKIGNLDLTGEQDRKQQEELEQMRRDLIQQGRLSAAEIKEIDRRQVLAQTPLRRPSILKKVIDENAVELRYIYNKKLRAGIRLSGKMVVEIQIRPDGNVRNAKIAQSNLGDQAFEQDVMTRIKAWQFKAVPDSLGDMTVNYPFEFYEEQ